MRFSIIVLSLGLLYFVFLGNKKVPKNGTSQIDLDSAVNGLYPAVAHLIIIDSMDFDSFRINGDLPLTGRKSDFEKGLGMPLKVEKVITEEQCVTFWNETDSFVYFEGIKCESKKDSLVVMLVNFQERKMCFLTYKTVRFSAQTTLEDMKKICPSIQPYDIAEGKIVVAIKVCVASDDKFLFIFKNGKLIDFEYFMPC